MSGCNPIQLRDQPIRRPSTLGNDLGSERERGREMEQERGKLNDRYHDIDAVLGLQGENHALTGTNANQSQGLRQGMLNDTGIGLGSKRVVQQRPKTIDGSRSSSMAIDMGNGNGFMLGSGRGDGLQGLNGYTMIRMQNEPVAPQTGTGAQTFAVPQSEPHTMNANGSTNSSGGERRSLPNQMYTYGVDLGSEAVARQNRPAKPPTQGQSKLFSLHPEGIPNGATNQDVGVGMSRSPSTSTLKRTASAMEVQWATNGQEENPASASYMQALSASMNPDHVEQIMQSPLECFGNTYTSQVLEKAKLAHEDLVVFAREAFQALADLRSQCEAKDSYIKKMSIDVEALVSENQSWQDGVIRLKKKCTQFDEKVEKLQRIQDNVMQMLRKIQKVATDCESFKQETILQISTLNELSKKLQQEIKEKVDQLKSVHGALDAKTGEHHLLDAEYDQLKARYEDLKKEYDDVKTAQVELQIQNAETKSKLEVCENRYATLHIQLQGETQKIEALVRELSDRDGQIKERNEALNARGNEISELNLERSSLVGIIAENQARIEALEHSGKAVSSRLASTEAQLAGKFKHCDSLEFQLKELSAGKSQMAASHSELQNRLDSARSKLDEVEERRIDLEKQLQALSAELESTKKSQANLLSDMKANFETLQRENQSLTSRISMFETEKASMSKELERAGSKFVEAEAARLNAESLVQKASTEIASYQRKAFEAANMENENHRLTLRVNSLEEELNTMASLKLLVEEYQEQAERLEKENRSLRQTAPAVVNCPNPNTPPYPPVHRTKSAFMNLGSHGAPPSVTNAKIISNRESAKALSLKKGAVSGKSTQIRARTPRLQRAVRRIQSLDHGVDSLSIARF